MNKLASKLSKVQSALKAPKGQRNNFGKYNYRKCEDILEAVKPLLATHDLALMITDEIVFIGDRHYIKATAVLTDGEEQYAVGGYARETQDKKGMDAAQITGAASSYARKYALNGMFAIDDTKDADGDEQTPQPPVQFKQKAAPKAEPKATAKQIAEIKAYDNSVQGAAAEFIKKHKMADSIAHLTEKRAASILSRFADFKKKVEAS